MTYRVFDHTADLGVEVKEATLEALYAGAACALFDLLTDLTSVRAVTSRELDVAGENPADLLVNFLREVLYAWNGEGFLMKGCDVRSVAPGRIQVRLQGEPFDPARHKILKEIKAVTYHHSAILEAPGEGWVARVVFDV